MHIPCVFTQRLLTSTDADMGCTTEASAYVLMKHWQATVSMRAGTVTLPAQKYGLACHSARPSFIAARSCLLRIIQLRRGSFLLLGPYSSVRLLPCGILPSLSMGKQRSLQEPTIQPDWPHPKSSRQAFRSGLPGLFWAQIEFLSVTKKPVFLQNHGVLKKYGRV